MTLPLYYVTFMLLMTFRNKKKIFTKLSNNLRPYSDKQIIMGGDFNCALTGANKTGGNSVDTKKTVLQEINNKCNILKLQDIWRYLYPNQSQYT